jgi:hypothetical protein
LAFATRTVIDGGEPVGVALTADRLIVLDAAGKPTEVIDDGIRIAAPAPVPVLEDVDVGVRSRAHGPVQVERGSDEARELVGTLWPAVQVFVPLELGPEQRVLGATWQRRDRYTVEHEGKQHTVEYELVYRTLASVQRAGRAVGEVAVTGTVKAPAVVVEDRASWGEGTVSGRMWIGPMPGASAGALRVALTARAEQGAASTQEQDVAYAVAPFEETSEPALAAQVRFDAQHAAGCDPRCVAGQPATAADDAPDEPAISGTPEPQTGQPQAGPTGSLPKAVIRKVIHERIGDVRACYEHALEGWPRVEGRVTTKFRIEADGQVSSSVTAGDEIGLLGLGCCINGAVKTWRFPAPEGGGCVVVTYPFIFETSAPASEP